MSYKRSADLFSVLANPFRIRLLYAIGRGEVCVCHLEAVLQQRQPFISQHLGVLRDQDLLVTRREGRYIFYRVKDVAVFDLIQAASRMQGISPGQLPEVAYPEPRAGCPCPSCEEGIGASGKNRTPVKEVK